MSPAILFLTSPIGDYDTSWSLRTTELGEGKEDIPEGTVVETRKGSAIGHPIITLWWNRGLMSHIDSHEGALLAQTWIRLALSWLLPLWKHEKSLMPHQLERSFLLREGLMGVIILFIEFGPLREAQPVWLPAVHMCVAMSVHLCCSVSADPVQTAFLL